MSGNTLIKTGFSSFDNLILFPFKSVSSKSGASPLVVGFIVAIFSP
jgi:hypothetical protein